MHTTVDTIQNAQLSAKEAALTNTLLIVGVTCAVRLSDRLGRIPLQVAGFFGCSLGVRLAALPSFASGTMSTKPIVTGFLTFNS